MFSLRDYFFSVLIQDSVSRWRDRTRKEEDNCKAERISQNYFSSRLHASLRELENVQLLVYPERISVRELLLYVRTRLAILLLAFKDRKTCDLRTAFVTLLMGLCEGRRSADDN